MAELTLNQRRAIAVAKAKASAKAKTGSGIMTNVNRGIADTAGGLVDMLNPFDQPHALNPFPQGTGSARTGIANVMERGGIDVAQGDPQTVLQGAARGFGNAAAAAFPVAKVAQAGQAAGGIIGRLSDDVYRAIASIPGLGAEVVAGGVSGAAQERAEQAGLPEWAQNTAAIAAPMSIPAAGAATRGALGVAGRMPVGSAIRQTGRSVAAAAAPYTRSGAQEVAARRMMELTGGKDRAAELSARITRDNPLNLTPAQQTEDPNLLALEQLGRAQDPNLRDRLDLREELGRETAFNEVQQPGDIQDTRAFFETRRREFADDLTQRAERIVSSATRDVEDIGPQRTESENSLQVSNRLNQALDDAKMQEKALWDRVPMATIVPTDQSRQALATWADRFGPVGMENIPPAAQRWLGDQGLDDGASVRDMHQLYSSLRETARSARAGTNTKPRLAAAADSIADAILDDLGASANIGKAGQAINEARAFSRAMHETFDRGAVGRLMKRTIDGDTSIDPELSLRRTVGRSGAEGMVGSRQVEEAAQFPRQLSPDRPESEQSPFVTDYIRQRFQDATITPTGEFNNRSAQKFLRDNRELLDRYPGLKDDVANAVQNRDSAGAFAVRVEDRIKRLNDARLSAGAALLNGSPDKALRAFTEARNPVRAARSIVNEARKDETGAALSGVKSLLSAELINRSKRTGQGLIDALEDPKLKAALRQVFTSAEMSRMRRLGRELSKLDAARRDVPSIGTSLSGASTNEFIETVARIKAAQIGGAMSSGSNMGGSLQTANILSNRVRKILGRLTADRASQMLADAIEDPELFRLLLSNPASVKDEKKTINLIAPYLIGGTSAAIAQE